MRYVIITISTHGIVDFIFIIADIKNVDCYSCHIKLFLLAPMRTYLRTCVDA